MINTAHSQHFYYYNEGVIFLDFTVLIDLKKESSNPTFGDLRLHHKECRGGSVETRREGKVIASDLLLCCRRCHTECKIKKADEISILSEMVKTAADKQERTIIVEKNGKDYTVSLHPRDPASDEISVIPEEQTLSIDLGDE